MTLADLRACLATMPPGTLIPADWVCAQLGAVEGEAENTKAPDFTAAELATRWGRGSSTVRTMCERGELAGAYRFRGREWRVPRATVLTYEAAERGRAEVPSDPPPLRARRPGRAPGVNLRELAKGKAS